MPFQRQEYLSCELVPTPSQNVDVQNPLGFGASVLGFFRESLEPREFLVAEVDEILALVLDSDALV